MSVIVKGMEMPVSGAKYRVVEDLEGNKYLTLYGVFDGQYYPISPLPEKHGRLIDADALDETFSRLNDDNWQLTRGDHKRMESVLFEMPIIVEAEGDDG